MTLLRGFQVRIGEYLRDNSPDNIYNKSRFISEEQIKILQTQFSCTSLTFVRSSSFVPEYLTLKFQLCQIVIYSSALRNFNAVKGNNAITTEQNFV